MLKVFEQAEAWQNLHKTNAESFLQLIRDLSNWDTMSAGSSVGESEMEDKQVFGIFQYLPETLCLIQGTYVKKLEETYCGIVACL